MKKVFSVVAILLAIAAAFLVGKWQGAGPAAPEEKGGRKILYYVDPMHPAYKSDKPGIAPDCGMRLEPVYADGGGAEAPADNRKVLYYQDPQDPAYKSDKPGLNPETGNDLEPVYADAPPPATLQISPEKQRMIGVKFGVVEWGTTASSLRTVGKVAADERRIQKVNSKVEGWIDKVYADFTGRVVRKGEPLLTLYSPEMLATQQEYLLAVKARKVLADSEVSGIAAQSESLLGAARKRLELWDLSDAQIDEIARTGKPVKNITLYSPAGGFITVRNAYPNQRIMPDTELYEITDLSHVWIIADVFESDIPKIRMGQGATVRLSYRPGRNFAARVTYILPEVDPNTRTLKVRLEAANAGMQLKPEMFVDVELRLAAARALLVPSDAVLDSGLRKTVFVDHGNGHLEPRQIETGDSFDGKTTVLSGLAAGERIAISGVFLIDSEAQLKGVSATATAPAGAHKHD